MPTAAAQTESAAAPLAASITHSRAGPLRLSLPVCLGLVLLAGGFMLFYDLGGEPIRDFDEGWYAKLVLDMVRSGNWLAYSFDGALDGAALKPPLSFWGMGLAFELCGPTNFAVRAFSAVCYLGLAAAVASACYRRWHAGVALLAAGLLIFDRQLLAAHGGRTGDTDAPLMLWLALTVIGLYATPRGWGYALAGAGWSLALLTKAHAAFQVLPALLVWLPLFRGRAATLRAAAVLALGVLPLAGVLALRESQQPGLIARLIGDELWTRATTEFDTDPKPPYVLWRSAVPPRIGLLAGLLIALLAARGRLDLGGELRGPAGPGQARCATNELLWLLLGCWLAPVVLFSLAATRHGHYLNPSFVPLYILCAWLLCALGTRLREMGRGRWLALAIGVPALMLATPAIDMVVRTRRGDRARGAEIAEMLAAARACAQAGRLIAAAPPPAVRFELTRAGTPYQPVRLEDAGRAALAAQEGMVVIAAGERERVKGLLGQQFADERCFPRINACLIEFRATLEAN